METTFCPNCQRESGFDRSTGEVFCDVCGLLEPPKYLWMRKPFVTCTVWRSIPTFLGGKYPWHAVFLEMHLMGIERSMFRGDLLSIRYNKTVGIEHMYKLMGLITYFSMN